MTSQGQSTSRKVTAWLPVILWAAVIFFFSTDAGASSNTGALLERVLSALYSGFTAHQIGTIHLIARKLGHWVEYFVLAMLVVRALQSGSEAAHEPRPRQLALALTIVIAYAVADELHQALVPTRTPSAGDVAIDTFGGICGVLWKSLSVSRRDPSRGTFQKT